MIQCRQWKRKVYISLYHSKETLSRSTERKLSTAINQAFGAAQLKVFYNSTPVIRLRHKDIVPGFAASFCVYSFSCSCGTGYIGRTTRRLSERVREHHPAWIYSNTKRSVSSAVLQHLLDSNHRVDVSKAFRPIYIVRSNLPRAARFRALATAEALAIKRNSPDLCAQKQFVRSLQLAWPTMQRLPSALWQLSICFVCPQLCNIASYHFSRLLHVCLRDYAPWINVCFLL